MEQNECHGDYSLGLFGNVAAVRIYGAWNLECARSYRREARSIREKFGGERFVSVIDLRRWELATPEAIEFLSTPGDTPPRGYDGRLREIQIGAPEGLALQVSRESVDRAVPGVAYVGTPEEALALLRRELPDFDAEELSRFLDEV